MGTEKLTIIAYKDPGYTQDEVKFNLQFNPESLKLNKSVGYTEQPVPGSQDQQKFDTQKANTLNFETILDDTGAVTNELGPISDCIERLESMLFTVNKETHEPNYAMIVWGTFIFYGRLTSMDYNYCMFTRFGDPIRVKITFSFRGYRLPQSSNRSPDLSRKIMYKAGETLASLCTDYYDDPSYCTDIAGVNNLAGFRKVKPGTKLLFPALVRHDHTSE